MCIKKLMHKYGFTELIAVVGCLIFATAISLYHISYEGYLGLSEKVWSSIWTISENGFALTLVSFLSTLTFGVVRWIFRIFIPYFALKLIYHFSVYSRIKLLEPETWEMIWSYALVILIIVSLLYVVIMLKRMK